MITNNIFPNTGATCLINLNIINDFSIIIQFNSVTVLRAYLMTQVFKIYNNVQCKTEYKMQ